MNHNDPKDQKKKKIDYSSMGMLYGIFVGGLLATIFATNTGDSKYYTLVGICMVIGIVIGSLYEQRQKDRNTPNG